MKVGADIGRRKEQTMSRWIDADALIRYGKRGTLVYWEDIEEMPSIDLVRCGECKFKSLYDGETKYYYCALEDRPNRQWSVDDWNFCYWGERKESE